MLTVLTSLGNVISDHIVDHPTGGLMASINKGRHAAAAGADGTVLFLIGMRINRLWQVWKWLPVFVAMPRMIAELMKHRELGLVGRPRTFLSGRTILVWQYWESFDKLAAFLVAPKG